MGNITDLLEVQKVRAPAGYLWSGATIMADDLVALHRLLAALSEILSRQLDSVDRLLPDISDSAGRAAFSEPVKFIRQRLLEAGRMLSQERNELQALRELRFRVYGCDAVGSGKSRSTGDADGAIV